MLKYLFLAEYLNIMGERLPFQQLGYNSVKDFILSVEIFKLEKRNNETIVQVVSNEKTKHLEDMIKKQKKPKKRVRICIILCVLCIIIFFLKHLSKL